MWCVCGVCGVCVVCVVCVMCVVCVVCGVCMRNVAVQQASKHSVCVQRCRAMPKHSVCVCV